MILKIRDEFQEEGWFLRDGISEIFYRRGISSSKLIKPRDRHFDAKSKYDTWSEMIVIFKDRTEEVWVSQVTTYLLNDNGKTIERIA